MNPKTYSPSIKAIHHSWHLIDLKDQILGRVAVKIARLLQGKHKPDYSPHLDCGDYVVAINAGEIKVTGRKQEQKTYFRHSGYPGGAKTVPYAKLLQTHPTRIITTAVSGMIAKNKLREPRLKRLKVFAGPEHTYTDKFKNLKS